MPHVDIEKTARKLHREIELYLAFFEIVREGRDTRRRASSWSRPTELESPSRSRLTR